MRKVYLFLSIYFASSSNGSVITFSDESAFLAATHSLSLESFKNAKAMNFSSTGGTTGILVTIGVFAVLCLITFICFIFSSNILAVIGQSGLSIITRLMGLILAVIGTQMIISGVTAVITNMK